MADFTLDDFRRQVRQIRKLGSLREVMKMIPGIAGQLAGMDPDADIRAIEAIIDSMTPAERAGCNLIEDSRCRRIARGSGADPEDVRKLIADFRKMQQAMQKFAGMKMIERMKRPRSDHDRPSGPGHFEDFELN